MAWEITGEAGRPRRRRGDAKRSGFSGLGGEGTDACGARSHITEWVARRFAWSPRIEHLARRLLNGAAFDEQLRITQYYHMVNHDSFHPSLPFSRFLFRGASSR